MKKIVCIVLAIAISTISLFAESIKESEAYKNMKEAQAFYQEAYEAGDYDKAQEYALQAKNYIEEVNKLIVASGGNSGPNYNDVPPLGEDKEAVFLSKKVTAEKSISAAERSGAYFYDSGIYYNAIRYYLGGIKAHEAGDYDRAVWFFEGAVERADKARAKAQLEKEGLLNSEKMSEAQLKLERMSRSVILQNGAVVFAPGFNADLILKRQFNGEDLSAEGVVNEAATPLFQAKALWISGVVALADKSDIISDGAFDNVMMMADKEDGMRDIVTISVPANTSLWYLAGQVYGNPFFWPAIWRANFKDIDDPWVINPGQTLIIPVP